MKYAFIKENQRVFSVLLMCDLFSVSRSGFYAWLTRKPSKRDQENVLLDAKIKFIFAKHKQRYGVPRITRELKKQNAQCSRTRVANRMKTMNMKAIAKKKFKVTTDSEHSLPVYNNVLNRDFTAAKVNQKWCCDISYIHTEEGWLYLAVVIDVYSRAVIGWSMNQRINKVLVCNALTMALFRRKFPKDVIVHSDRGSQYCSIRYQNLLKNHRLVGSMSRKGNCWDNAIAESFFHTLKVELIHTEKYATRDQAKQSIFEYIEGYYNQLRSHSSIDYKAPFEFECAC